MVRYATVMVHLELGRSNSEVLRVALDLAKRLDSRVIGIAACQPLEITLGDSYVSGDLIEQGHEEISAEMKLAEEEFRKATDGSFAHVEWRSAIMSPTIARYVAHESRCADLIVTGIASNSFFDAQRQVRTDDLVMQAGRPILVVPAVAEHITLKNVLVGWKDTRETRRAIIDSLPLLKAANYVALVEIATGGEISTARSHLSDVSDWLKQHGIVAESIVSESLGDDSNRLQTVAYEQSADVIVAGAYGHSRLREWAFGGMTKELLRPEKFCSFLSH